MEPNIRYKGPKSQQGLWSRIAREMIQSAFGGIHTSLLNNRSWTKTFTNGITVKVQSINNSGNVDIIDINVPMHMEKMEKGEISRELAWAEKLVSPGAKISQKRLKDVEVKPQYPSRGKETIRKKRSRSVAEPCPVLVVDHNPQPNYIPSPTGFLVSNLGYTSFLRINRWSDGTDMETYAEGFTHDDTDGGSITVPYKYNPDDYRTYKTSTSNGYLELRHLKCVSYDGAEGDYKDDNGDYVSDSEETKSYTSGSWNPGPVRLPNDIDLSNYFGTDRCGVECTDYDTDCSGYVIEYYAPENCAGLVDTIPKIWVEPLSVSATNVAPTPSHYTTEPDGCYGCGNCYGYSYFYKTESFKAHVVCNNGHCWPGWCAGGPESATITWLVAPSGSACGKPGPEGPTSQTWSGYSETVDLHTWIQFNGIEVTRATIHYYETLEATWGFPDLSVCGYNPQESLGINIEVTTGAEVLALGMAWTKKEYGVFEDNQHWMCMFQKIVHDRIDTRTGNATPVFGYGSGYDNYFMDEDMELIDNQNIEFQPNTSDYVSTTHSELYIKFDGDDTEYLLHRQTTNLGYYDGYSCLTCRIYDYNGTPFYVFNWANHTSDRDPRDTRYYRNTIQHGCYWNGKIYTTEEFESLMPGGYIGHMIGDVACNGFFDRAVGRTQEEFIEAEMTV